MQEVGELEVAEGYYLRLLDYGVSVKEGAKASLREIRGLVGGGGGTHGGFTPGPGGPGRGEGLGGGSTPGSDMGTSPM